MDERVIENERKRTDAAFGEVTSLLTLPNLHSISWVSSVKWLITVLSHFLSFLSWPCWITPNSHFFLACQNYYCWGYQIEADLTRSFGLRLCLYSQAKSLGIKSLHDLKTVNGRWVTRVLGLLIRYTSSLHKRKRQMIMKYWLTSFNERILSRWHSSQGTPAREGQKSTWKCRRNLGLDERDGGWDWC